MASPMRSPLRDSVRALVVPSSAVLPDRVAWTGVAVRRGGDGGAATGPRRGKRTEERRREGGDIWASTGWGGGCSPLSPGAGEADEGKRPAGGCSLAMDMAPRKGSRWEERGGRELGLDGPRPRRRIGIFLFFFFTFFSVFFCI